MNEPRHVLCGVCNGVHRNPPDCLGRPQTDREWMIDRGVSPERCDEIEAARARTRAGGIDPGRVQPTTPNNVPLPASADPDQEALF